MGKRHGKPCMAVGPEMVPAPAPKKGFGWFRGGKCCCKNIADNAEGLTLRDMKPGDKARILKIRRHGVTNRRLAEMGMTPGTEIKVVRVAPMGDPIEVSVRGYSLSLRKEEAAAVLIERV